MEILRVKAYTEKNKPVFQLPFGAEAPDGTVYTADSVSLMKNGKRFIPVMGEMHFSRVRETEWEDELLKMKAGGVDIVSTYVLWIHHEEREGEWDFSGQKNLRAFLENVKKVGMQCWLRIGPWAHGECRNGGFPDDVEHADYETRTNSEGYLRRVDAFFGKIGEQAAGMMIQDGGPVLGIQIENEYGHCGGPKERDVQIAHMEKLRELAEKHGLKAAYVTATAWGGACAPDDMLQVLGGYVDAPWDISTEKLPPQRNYLFIPYFDDSSTGSDFEIADPSVTMIRADRPYLTAEIGGGLQVTGHRRPIVSGQDNAAAIICTLGAGANLIGYYMYHGGTNPDGKYSTLNECQAVGGHTNVPVKSYDFNACVNEAGMCQESYGVLKKYHHFLHTFGGELAGMPTWLPETRPKTADDSQTLRFAVRYDAAAGKGFLFINNHARNLELAAHEEVTVEIETEEALIRLSGLCIGKDAVAVIPFEKGSGSGEVADNGKPVCEAVFTAAPLLCRLGDRVFRYESTAVKGPEQAGKVKAYAALETASRTVSDPAAEEKNTTILTESEADRSFLFEDGLYIVEHADSCIIEKEGKKVLISNCPEEDLLVYRGDGTCEKCHISAGNTALENECGFVLKNAAESEEKVLSKTYEVKLPEALGEQTDYVEISYTGDRAEIHDMNGKLTADWFSTGLPWRISRALIDLPDTFTVTVYDSDNLIPCTYADKVFYDLPVEKGCELKKVTVKHQWKTVL